MPLIFCECGCSGEIVPKPYHKYYGVPKFIQGHNPSPTKRKQHFKISVIFCKCGCGQSLNNYDSQGRKREYINYHNPKKINSGSFQDGHKFSEEIIRKLSISHIKNPIDRITPINLGIRTLPEFLEWKLQVRSRDEWTCQHCGIKKVWMEAHHIITLSDLIKQYNIKSLEGAILCDALWDLDNGITYCKPCHELLKKKGGLL